MLARLYRRSEPFSVVQNCGNKAFKIAPYFRPSFKGCDLASWDTKLSNPLTWNIRWYDSLLVLQLYWTLKGPEKYFLVRLSFSIWPPQQSRKIQCTLWCHAEPKLLSEAELKRETWSVEELRATLSNPQFWTSESCSTAAWEGSFSIGEVEQD